MVEGIAVHKAGRTLVGTAAAGDIQVVAAEHPGMAEGEDQELQLRLQDLVQEQAVTHSD